MDKRIGRGRAFRRFKKAVYRRKTKQFVKLFLGQYLSEKDVNSLVNKREKNRAQCSCFMCQNHNSRPD